MKSLQKYNDRKLTKIHTAWGVYEANKLDHFEPDEEGNIHIVFTDQAHAKKYYSIINRSAILQYFYELPDKILTIK